MTNDCPILIVDDDKEDHLLLLEYFREKGIADKVAFVENGQQAMAYLGAISEACDLPRLVVLDMNMPILNGFQTLTQMKQQPRLKNIPIIILSTIENETEHRRAMNLGAVDYLVKPITYNEGAKIIDRFASFIDD